MKSKTRILIVDDHALIRRGLADLLRYEKDLAVVGEASDGEAAVAVATELKPDVVVMDLMMPVMDGVEATQRIKEALPETKILILTTFGTSVDVARAIAAGASGAIVKDASMEDQLHAIRTVASGGKVLSPEIEKTVQEEPLPEFTKRQLVILESAARGLTNKDIANMLNISPDAVKQHLAAICSKLGAANRAEAVNVAHRKRKLPVKRVAP